MHPFVHFLMAGAVSKVPWGQALRHLALAAWKTGWVLRVFKLILMTAMLCGAFHAVDRPERVHGDWVDQAFSEVMSRRLGGQVQIQDVRFIDWTYIRFGAVVVRDGQGALLGFAGSGDIRLRRAGVRKDNFFETEVRLTDATLTPEYYHRARRQPVWAKLMRKPLLIRKLSARVRQNDAQTEVKITECRSRDVRLEGELIYRPSGVVEDRLEASMSPWRFLSTVF